MKISQETMSYSLRGLFALCLTTSLSAYGVTDEEVRNTCTQCHNLTFANGFELVGSTTNEVGSIALKTLAGWTGTITRMQGAGAVLASGSTVADYANYLYAAQSGSPATVALSSLAVTPINSTISAGQTKQYTATGTLSDNSIRDLTVGGFPTIKAMNLNLESHTATLVNGKVLIAGGSTQSVATAAAELYDPATGIFSPTGPMTIRRWAHMDVLLGTGKVLLAGGHTGGGWVGGPEFTGIYLDTAELYDPVTGTFSATDSMSMPRAWASIVALGSGSNAKVLIAGGSTGSVVTNTAELYDPITGRFSTISKVMTTARSNATATLLKNGKVLIAGGATTATAEVYDPVRGTFKATAGPMKAVRYHHTATLLADGRVLIAGGGTGSVDTASVEIYDPTTNTFATMGAMARPRWWHTATLLENGKVLMAGGRNWNGGHGTSDPVFEFYDPATGSSSFIGSMYQRWIHTATLLQNGQILLTGGTTRTEAATASAEIYTPTVWSSGNTSIATINSTGLASSGTSPGTTSIIATSGSTSGSTSLLNSGSDMTVTAVSGNVTSVTRGSSFTITSSTKNQGNAFSGVTTKTGFYLSTDVTITSSDKLLGSANVSSLSAGNSVQTSTTVSVPGNQARGTYYLGAIADYTGLATEINEGNNSFTGTTIQVQ